MPRRPPPDLIDCIYDATVDPVALQNLATKIAQALNANSGSMQVFDRSLARTEQVSLANIDTSIWVDYQRDFADKDLWAQASSVSASNAVQHFAELVSEDRLLRSDFYNGFIRKTELFHGLGAALPHGDRVGMIAFHRPRGANIFADEEQQLMLTILPHLTRLLQIRARLNDAELLQGTLEQSLQTLGFGVIVIDALNRIVFANRLGEAALRDGPLRHSTVAGLSATTMQENIRLKTVVAQALQRRGPAAGSVRLSRPAGGADLQMTVAPLRPADRSGQEMAMLLLADPGSPDPGLAPRLQQMFGLSKTEALLFALLAQGATVDEVARDRGVGVSTVRSQVRTLFQKTGVSRQGALISLATALPRIHEPG